MTKSVFIVSSLFKEKLQDKKCVVLDNYIAVNNPELNCGELHACPRNSKNDWLRYEKKVVDKHSKYSAILTERLNKLHNINYSDRYWQQLFYLGIKRYIALVYEFFNQVESRFDHENHDFRLLDKESFYTPFDLEDLRSYLSYSEHAYEQLFSIYIEQFYSELIGDDLKIMNIGVYKPKTKKQKHSFIKRAIYSIYDKLKIFNPTVILLGVQYSPSKIKKLLLKSKSKIFLYVLAPFERPEVKLNNIDVDKRDGLSVYNENFDKFDKFFFKTLESFFPIIFIEDYSDASKYYDYQAKLFPKVKYIISESWISSSSMMFFIAHQQKMHGTKFISTEHKGVAHTYENNLLEDMVNISDLFFTVGWYHKDFDKSGKLIKTGLMSPAKSSNDNIVEYKNKILYMTAPAYAKRTNYVGNNFFTGEDSKYFFDFQKSFFSELDTQVLNNIIYRSAPIMRTLKIATYNHLDILKKYIKYMQIDSGKYSGPDAMLSSKLVVINYMATGYIESIINNIPTIIFLNKNMYLTSYGEEMYSELIDQEIIQSDPKKAAHFLMRVEKEPEKWWYSEEVQKARKSFLSKVVGDSCVLEKTILELM